VVDDPSRRVGLEITDFFRQVLGRRDEVGMVLKDDVSEKRQAILMLKKRPRIEHDLKGLGPCENR